MVVCIKVVEYIFTVNIQYHLSVYDIVVMHLKILIQIKSGFMNLIDESRSLYNRYMYTLFMDRGITFIFVINGVSSVKT